MLLAEQKHHLLRKNVYKKKTKKYIMPKIIFKITLRTIYYII